MKEATTAPDFKGKLRSLIDDIRWGLSDRYRYPDVMIDIEALADTPDSAPAQIALLFFDRDDRNKEFLRFNYEPRPMDAIRLGFNITGPTLKWWEDNGLKPDLNTGEPLGDVLEDIARDFQNYGTKSIRVWSRGNAYDLAILRLAYTRTGRPLPWQFWNDRDVRTWLEGCQFKSPRKNNHDAMQDCENQALDVIEATAAIPVIEATAAITDHVPTASIIQEKAQYWHDISDCDCSSPLPQGGCLKCDMRSLLRLSKPNRLGMSIAAIPTPPKPPLNGQPQRLGAFSFFAMETSTGESPFNEGQTAARNGIEFVVTKVTRNKNTTNESSYTVEAEHLSNREGISYAELQGILNGQPQRL